MVNQMWCYKLRQVNKSRAFLLVRVATLAAHHWPVASQYALF